MTGPVGCILADEMGLGKTLQAIAFIHSFISRQEGKTVLVVVPINVLHNWKVKME